MRVYLGADWLGRLFGRIFTNPYVATESEKHISTYLLKWVVGGALYAELHYF